MFCRDRMSRCCVQTIFRNCLEEPNVLLAAFEHDIKALLLQQPVTSPANKRDAADPQYDKYWIEATRFVCIRARACAAGVSLI